jgi:hypothetical protein
MHPDGEIHVRSRRPIRTLIAAGCFPIRRHRDGTATFAKTSTVQHLIDEYVRSSVKR